MERQKEATAAGKSRGKKARETKFKPFTGTIYSATETPTMRDTLLQQTSTGVGVQDTQTHTKLPHSRNWPETHAHQFILWFTVTIF